MKIEMIETEKLIPYARNAKKHSKSQVASIASSIKEFGFNNPVLVDKDYGIIAGHGRVLAAQKLGLKDVPCIRLGHLTENQKKAYIIADNRLAETGGGWDGEMLKLELDDLKLEDFNIDLTGFDFDLVAAKKEKEENIFDVSGDIGGAFELKKDMMFKSDEKYNIPCILKEKLGTIPENITCWAGKDVSEKSDHYFYNVNTDSVKGLDFTKTVIGFYTDDYRFECFWEKPDEYTSKLINRKPLSIISPNYSLWFEQAEAVKIWNTYRSRWIGRYAQEAGLNVIPDVNFSDEKSFDYCFLGIPKNAPCLSIQIQTAKKTKEEIEAKNKAIKKLIKELLPDSLFVYHGKHSEEILENLPNSLKIIKCSNRLTLREKAMKGGD